MCVCVCVLKICVSVCVHIYLEIYFQHILAGFEKVKSLYSREVLTIKVPEISVVCAELVNV